MSTADIITGHETRATKLSSQRQRAWVVVLGDFGRSPRMQYHAMSLAEQVRREQPRQPRRNKSRMRSKLSGIHALISCAAPALRPLA